MSGVQPKQHLQPYDQHEAPVFGSSVLDNVVMQHMESPAKNPGFTLMRECKSSTKIPKACTIWQRVLQQAC